MIRTKEFKSKPYITREMIARVIAVMHDGLLSGYSASNPEKLNGGKYVQELERKWADYHKVKYAIAVNSATSGLITALRALEIGSGDEVVTTPFTVSMTWTPIKLVGAEPVFADVELDTMALSWERVEESISKANSKAKAIMAVHWNGNAGRTHHLKKVAKEHGLYLIEDAAQTPGVLHGDQYLGTFGNIGVYSLNQPKNIMCGEGGVIVTNDDELDRRCRLIRNHGENVDPDWTGYNFRLTEIQAAIAIEMLKNLDYLNNIRHRNWLYLCDQLREYGDILKPQLITNRETYAPYTVAFRWMHDKIARDEVAKTLRTEGIPVATGVPYLPVNLPNSNILQRLQYLGFFQIGWPNTYEDIDDIVKGFKKVL